MIDLLLDSNEKLDTLVVNIMKNVAKPVYDIEDFDDIYDYNFGDNVQWWQY